MLTEKQICEFLLAVKKKESVKLSSTGTTTKSLEMKNQLYTDLALNESNEVNVFTGIYQLVPNYPTLSI